MDEPGIPHEWQGVLNAPLRWLDRRVPRRYRKIVLIALVLLVTIPIAWQAWQSIGSAVLQPRGPTLLVLPHYDFPYGFAYWRGAQDKLERLRAYPVYNADMHIGPLQQADVGKAADAIHDAYRITLANPSDSKFVITTVTMRLRKYEKLPERYVCVWSRKGLEQVVTADFDLRPDAKETRLIGDKQVIDLAPGEAQVIIARVRDAKPGLYTFAFAAQAQSLRGHARTLESDEFRILVPNRDAAGPSASRGVSVAFSGDDRALVPRLLGLDGASWQKLRDATNPRSLDLDFGIDLRSAMAGNDGTFVQKMLDRAAAPASELRPPATIDCNASTMHAADCAPLLIAAGRDEQATRVLRDGLTREPDDVRAAARLTQLLLRKNKRAAARQVWQEAYRRSPPNEELLDAGLELAEATGDIALAQQLAAKARFAFPDSGSILIRRIKFYERQHQSTEVLDALTAVCRHYPQLRAKHDQQVLRRAIVVAAVHVSNSGEKTFKQWLSSALQRCPATIAWDLRVSPSFWHYDPSFADRWPNKIPGGAHGIFMARSLIASGRPLLAFLVLNQIVVDRTSSPAIRTEAAELIGDMLLAIKPDEAAGNAYLVAYRENGLPKVRMEGIAIKAALAYSAAGSSSIRRVFEAAGPYERPVSQSPHRLFALYDPPRAAERTYGLMTLFYAFDHRSYDLALKGLVATLAAEPAWELGQDDDPVRYWKGLSPLADAMLAWKAAPQSNPKLPQEFIDYIANLYTREDAILSIDETGNMASEGTESTLERLTLAPQLLGDFGIKSYFVRARGGVFLGTETETSDSIFLEKEKSFAAWRAEQIPLNRGAKPGVYLEKLTGAQYDAERKFLEGVNLAFRFYNLDGGLKAIESSLEQDPKNVHALKIAAQLHTIQHRPQRCLDLTAKALALDPYATGVSELRAICSEAAARRQ